MYGIVNKAIEELIVLKGGQEAWQKVCQSAGVDIFTFIAQEKYDDDVTYRLVTAAAKELGLCPHSILLEFGGHWARYTGKEGYGYLFKLLGEDLGTFLENLPELHDQIALIFPDLIMPRFETERLSESEVRVVYRSTRPGLAPMVHGLLEGMGEFYGCRVAVSHEKEKSESFDADEFLVHFGES